MEMNGLDCAKCQIVKGRDMIGINEKVNQNMTKLEIVVFSIFEDKNVQGLEMCRKLGI